MIERISCFLVILFVGTLMADEPKQSVFSKAFGKNFERNSTLLAMSLSKGRPSPSDILKEQDVRIELGISKEQADDLAELDIGSSPFPDVMAIAGLGDGKAIASLNEKQVSDAGGLILRELKSYQAEREKKVKDILTPKQYERMREIFLQKILLSGIRNQVAEFLGLEPEEIVKMNLALQEADKEIAIEIQKMKWHRYLEKFDEQVGPGTSRKSFGKPFYVDVEYRESESESNNRRRGSD